MSKTSRSLLCLPLLFLTACGAKWRSFHDDPPVAGEDFVEQAEHELSGPSRAHGHRDFPQSFAVVWPITVDVLHTRGIGVPKSARPTEERAIVDLDGIYVLVEERYKGRVCVLLRFRALEGEEGQAAAQAMLDEIQDRL